MKQTSLMPVAAIVVAAALGWLLAPGEDAVAPLVQVRRDVWRLPDLPRKPDLIGTGLAVVTSPIFDAETPAGTAVASEDTRWRIAGIFRRGTERTVLVSFMAPGKESLRLRVGQSMPGGQRITRIDDSEVSVQIGNKTVRLGVASSE